MYRQPVESAQSLRNIHLPGVNSLSVKWSPRHLNSLNYRILASANHPLHEQVKRRWDTRTDPFWWTCIASIKACGTKKILRGWLNNRAKAAFRNALKNKGYAGDGARLMKDSRESAQGDLVGSAQLFVTSELLGTSWEALCKQADLIVTAIEEAQKRGDLQNRKTRRLKIFGGGPEPKAAQFRSMPPQN